MEPLYGVLDMLVLRTLLFGPRHGYGVAAGIRDSSRDAVTIEFGSLYPALKRLELKGWIASKWETSTEWAKFVAGVAMIMNPAAGEVD
jgi:DNA-binding PadR family transcriptional regulator